MSEILDARGVPITAGDVVIYGFGVSRSVALAEGVVVGDGEKVALTPTGRIKVRVVRRSYASGEKPVVDVASDRLVVLKHYADAEVAWPPSLPPSPLPTQDEVARKKFEANIASRLEEIERVERGGGIPDYWHGDREGCLKHYRRQLAKAKRGLEALG